MEPEDDKPGALLRGEDADARREAAATMGRIRSPRKAASSAENGRLYGGKKVGPLAEINCTCGRGESLEHPTTCPRGRVIRYRQKKGLPLT